MGAFNYCDPFKGNISGTEDSDTFTLPRLINNYTIVNKTGGAVTVNVYLIGLEDINISPLNKSINANESYENTVPRVALPTESIRVQSSGSVDYFFQLSNIELPNGSTSST